MSDTELQFKVGDRTRATQSIYEGPDDYAPGGYLCRKGDLLIVRKVCSEAKTWPYDVSHEDVTDNSFKVAPNEIAEDRAAAAIATLGDKG